MMKEEGTVVVSISCVFPLLNTSSVDYLKEWWPKIISIYYRKVFYTHIHTNVCMCPYMHTHIHVCI